MGTRTAAQAENGVSLKGRVAIVTGSTSGIGLGIARALASAGADVVINGLGDPAVIEATRTELSTATDARVAYLGANLLDGEDAASLVTRTMADFGKVDILVNNAGIQHVSSIEDFPVDKWDAIQALNLSASFHTTRAAFAAMKTSGWGRIINLASVHGLAVADIEREQRQIAQ
jgi:3-hydroxybutyrate dehydrogenase